MNQSAWGYQTWHFGYSESSEMTFQYKQTNPHKDNSETKIVPPKQISDKIMKEVICACGVCLYSCLNWQNVFVSNCKNAFVSNWKHVFVSICKKCISFKLQTCICLKLKKNMSLYQFAKNVVVSNWRKMYICLKLNRLLRGRGDGITFVRRSLYFSQVAKMYLHHSSHSQSQSQSNLNLKKMYLFQIAKFICIKLKTWSWIQVLNCLKCQKFYTRLDGASKDAQCPSFTLLLLLVFVMVIEVRMCLDTCEKGVSELTSFEFET